MSLSAPSAVTRAVPAAAQPSDARNRLVLVVYTAAIFVSALLLFSVQPLFTKMVLPRLGGSPAVWSVAMVFFQSLLLAGYAYAYLLMQIRNCAIPVAVHLVLLVIALLTLPLSIAGGFGDPAEFRLRVLAAARAVRGLDRPAFLRARRQQSDAAGLVRAQRDIRPGPIPTSSMRPPTSAASSRFCPIRCCWSRCSPCAPRT